MTLTTDTAQADTAQAETHGDFATESRTVTWATPGQGDLAALATLDGLGQLLAIREGTLPHAPIVDTIGMTDLRPERGRVTVEMPTAAFHYNPLGGVHGGVIATVLDTACGCAVHSTLAVGEGYSGAGEPRWPRPNSPTSAANWSPTPRRAA